MITATSTPKKLRIIDRILSPPPRTLGANARMMPKTPNTKAIAAKITPRIAPNLKLKMAAISAKIEVMLNDDLLDSITTVFITYPGNFNL